MIMHKESTASDILRSFIHALVMASLMDKSESISLHAESHLWMDKYYAIFLTKVLFLCHLLFIFIFFLKKKTLFQ